MSDATRRLALACRLRRPVTAEDDKAMEAQGTEGIRVFDKCKEQCNSYFNESIKVQARYNRCIIFDGRKYHGGQNFYGTNSSDARLTIVFFGQGH